MYDERVWSLVLNTDNFAEFFKPSLEVILCSILSVSLDIDFWVPDSGGHRCVELE